MTQSTKVKSLLGPIESFSLDFTCSRFGKCGKWPPWSYQEKRYFAKPNHFHVQISFLFFFFLSLASLWGPITNIHRREREVYHLNHHLFFPRASVAKSLVGHAPFFCALISSVRAALDLFPTRSFRARKEIRTKWKQIMTRWSHCDPHARLIKHSIMHPLKILICPSWQH